MFSINFDPDKNFTDKSLQIRDYSWQSQFKFHMIELTVDNLWVTFEKTGNNIWWLKKA